MTSRILSSNFFATDLLILTSILLVIIIRSVGSYPNEAEEDITDGTLESLKPQCSSTPKINVVSYWRNGFSPAHLWDTELIPGKIEAFIQAPYIAHVGLECLSSSPIEWKFEGVNNPSAKVTDTVRKVLGKHTEPCFISVLTVKTNRRSTGRYKCQSINETLSSSLYIYGEANNVPALLNDGQNLNLVYNGSDTVILPCQVVNRSLKPYLFKGKSGSEVDVSATVPYNPEVGFILDLKNSSSYPFDLYKCNWTLDWVNINLKEPSDLEVSPAGRKILIVRNHSVRLTCKSKSDIGFEVNDVPVKSNSDWTSYGLIYFISYVFQGTETSKVSCVDINTRRTLHTWTCLVISEDIYGSTGILYDSATDKFICSKTDVKPSMVVLKCVNPTNCRFMKKCFETDAPYTIEGGREDPNCKEIEIGSPCDESDQIALNSNLTTCSYASADRSLNSGLVFCGFDGESDQSMEFFRGIDGNNTVITSWSNALPNQLILIENPNRAVYVGENVKFTCKAVKYIFTRGFKWMFLMINGTQRTAEAGYIPNADRSGWREPIHSESVHLKIDDPNIVAVGCLAPFWNTSDFYGYDRTDYWVTISVKEQADFEVSPSGEKILLVTNGSVGMTCSSESPIGFEVNDVRVEANSHWTGPRLNYSIRYVFQGTDTSKVSCVDLNTKGILHTWNCRVISEEMKASAGIIYDSKTHKFVCRSKTDQKPEMVVLNCTNPTNYNFIKSCPDLDAPITIQGSRDNVNCKTIEVGTPCDSSEQVGLNSTLTGHSCASANNGLNGGLVYCRIAGGPDQSMQFFRGDDGNNDVITSWSETLPNQLIKIEGPNRTVYVGVDVKFSCKGVKYISTPLFTWVLLMANGTRRNVKVERIQSSIRTRYEEPFSESVNLIIDDPNIVAVGCLVQFWNTSELYKCNSTDWYTINLMEPPDFAVSPDWKKVLVVRNHSLKLTCKSESPISFEVNHIPVEVNTHKTDSKLNYSISYVCHGNVTSEVSCIDLNTKGILHTWNCLVISEEVNASAGIFYDSSTDKFFCRSKTDQKPAMIVLNCSKPADCNSMRSCFEFDTQYTAQISSKDTNCNAIDEGILCDETNQSLLNSTLTACSYASANHRFNSWLVHCRFDGGTDQSMQFLRAIDGNATFITSWREVLPNQLIQIEVPNRTLYTEEDVVFTCTAVKYISTSAFTWVFLMTNGSHRTVNAKNILSSEVTQWEEPIYSETVNLTIDDSNIVSVGCLVQFGNTTEWFNSSSPLLVKVGVRPKILNGNDTVVEVTSGLDHSVRCKIEGNPKPTVRWFKNDMEIMGGHSEEILNPSTNLFDSWLHLGIVDEVDDAEYRCTATNVLGDDTYPFRLQLNFAQSRGILLLVTGIIFFVCFVSIVLILSRKLFKKNKLIQQLMSDKDIQLFREGDQESLLRPPDGLIRGEFLRYDSEFEIPMNSLKIEEKLGDGAFGIVHKGIYKPNSEDTETEVAVKTPRGTAHCKALLSELKILIYLGRHGHGNIVSLHGAVTENLQYHDVYVVLEYCHLGDLGNFLRRNKFTYLHQIKDDRFDLTMSLTGQVDSNEYYTIYTMSTSDILNWSVQVASGMEYLEVKKIVHGDLAARNILLTGDRIAKITDFGLSIRLDEDYTNVTSNSQNDLPWRWLAPEILQQSKFSHQSDVWAFGVTLWEIFSMGELPYPGLKFDADFKSGLLQGIRLKKPRFANTDLYNEMLQCWRILPNERVKFSDIRKFFHRILLNTTYPQIPTNTEDTVGEQEENTLV